MTQLFNPTAQYDALLPHVRVSAQIASGVEVAMRQDGHRKQAEYVRTLIVRDLIARGILVQEVSQLNMKNK